jgi:hypothetical protein
MANVCNPAVALFLNRGLVRRAGLQVAVANQGHVFGFDFGLCCAYAGKA